MKEERSGEDTRRRETVKNVLARMERMGGAVFDRHRCSQLFFFSLQLESHDSMERRRRRRRCTEQLRRWWGEEETTPS